MSKIRRSQQIETPPAYDADWIAKEFARSFWDQPAAISLNSQGWKYFVSLTPGQCVPVDGASYQGIPVVIDRGQVEPVVLKASPGLSAPTNTAAES